MDENTNGKLKSKIFINSKQMGIDMFEELQNAQKSQGNNEELKRQPFKNSEANF